MISIKIHESYRKVVGICDSDLIGKKFVDGKRQLDCKESFYKGEEVNEERAIEIIRRQAIEDASFNIVGKESIQAAIKSGLIEETDTAELQGIPFALTLL